ncbi:hypothetical protein ABZT17_11645 [Streptomyces sp. NPDC005648]|uniref:hypothetical protein n=1 Tax=Streptomyces sp. NPDC005648 TaxID=3157044 RepID=UPI0033B4E5D3
MSDDEDRDDKDHIDFKGAEFHAPVVGVATIPAGLWPSNPCCWPWESRRRSSSPPGTP